MHAGLILGARSLVGAGCGSGNCTETLTCAPVDASAEGDSPFEPGEAAVQDATFDGDGPVDAVSETPGAADGPVDARADVALDGTADGPIEAGDSSTPCNPTAPDCSNPACTPSFACTPVAPSGWFGPVALYDQGGGPPPPTPPSCSGVYTDDSFDGFADPTSPPLTCTCTCGSVSGGGCSTANIAVYGDGQCTNMCATAGASTCSTADGPACNTGGASLKVVAGPTATGTWSCPAGTMRTTTPWGWSRVGRGCASTRAFATGGCQANQVCANAPPASFHGTLCVYKKADLPDCNGAPGYPLVYKYYTNVQDGRSCALGTCGCSAPPNPCVLQGAQWFNTALNANCASGGHAIDISGKCNANLGGSQVVTIEASIGASGSCPTTGSGASTGSVTPDTTTAVTVCCAQ